MYIDTYNQTQHTSFLIDNFLATSFDLCTGHNQITEPEYDYIQKLVSVFIVNGDLHLVVATKGMFHIDMKCGSPDQESICT
jgi:hypothetical protein